MRVRGLHLLITYKCNARCRHCFLNASPYNSSVISPELVFKIIDEAADLSNINHLFIEGGEPFLYPELMRQIVARAHERGLWIGALTNGFWAASTDTAKKVLSPLIDAGLDSLSISTDAWHQEFVSLTAVKTATAAAGELGLQTDIMVCDGPLGSSAAGVDKIKSTVTHAHVYAGGVVCRGRASYELCENGQNAWRELTKCEEGLGDPSRVHIGPSGEVHLCQGLLVGESVGTRSLKSVLDSYRPGDHPIASKLLAGGPAALAKFAAEKYGFQPKSGYGDNCHLCYEVRSFLQQHFPSLIGPPEVFADYILAGREFQDRIS